MPSKQYENLILGQTYHDKDIVRGPIRICYQRRSRKWVVPGGEVLGREEAERLADGLVDYLNGALEVG